MNLRLLPDSLPSADEWRTSATLHASEAAARAHIEEQVATFVHFDERTFTASGMHAFWPPRD